MPGGFLDISDLDELAAYFELTYDGLAEIAYGLSDSYKYTEFAIPKKGGGSRTIDAPCARLKALQRRLAAALDDIHSPQPAAHGFLKDRSIVTNARAHVDKNKTFVFNLDLSGFFDCIHFGRVKHLFMAWPFRFSSEVATVLAQICCFKNALPQGAPTSPVVANMIAWKLDKQLQGLARDARATYTRYADDISFSFSCSKSRLPGGIVTLSDGVAMPGAALTELVDDNGFKINYGKVRLAGRSRRMEVTGLTVNEFPNVPRKYVRQISSILHAWRTYGYDAAQKHFNDHYDTRHRPSGLPKSLASVVWGKLAFLKSVTGEDSSVFVKLAWQYNELVGGDRPHLQVRETLDRVAAAAEPTGTYVVDPQRPFSNRRAIRDLVSGAHGCLRWFERDLPAKALEVIADEVGGITVTEMRLLSGDLERSQGQAGARERVRKDLLRLRKELVGAGVTIEWRELRAASIPHDRVFISDAGAFNVPPLNIILKGDTSEILPSKLTCAWFDDLWERAASL